MYYNSDKWYEDQINKQQEIIDRNIAIIEELQRPANEIKSKLELIQQEIKNLQNEKNNTIHPNHRSNHSSI